MKTSNTMIEQLERRQLFSASAFAHSTVSTSAAGLRPVVAAPVKPGSKSGSSTTATVTDYSGTAVNQNDRSSQITVVVTSTAQGRTGVLNVNSNSGGTTPITFAISRAGTFSFSFSLPGEKDTATGKLSADGGTLTGTWKSLTTAGKKGSGKFTATRV